MRNINTNNASIVNRNMRKHVMQSAIIFAAIIIFCMAGAGCNSNQRPGSDTSTTGRTGTTGNQTGSKTFFVPVSDVARNVRPSVVSIGVRSSGQEQTGSDNTGIGSGVIYSNDGYIITNNHVVSGATDIVVAVGTEEVSANLVAADPDTDIAVIRINKNNLKEAEFASTRDMKAGDPVVAIGSPFGLEHTVTFGIVSAQGRNLSIRGEQNNQPVTYTDLIQTDAAINPGNSGGALCNMNSQVIGINTLVASTSGEFNGIGFAIPSDIATDIAQQLIDSGRASHPYMGIRGRSISDIRSLPGNTDEINVENGVFIVGVEPGSPAANAGLKHGDIITAINDSQVADAADLISELRKHDVGDKVTVTYVNNDGSENKVTITLVEKPAQTRP